MGPIRDRLPPLASLSNTAKAALRDELLSNRNALDLWVLLGGLAFPASAAILHAPSALCAVFAYALKRKNNGIERALQDPPRDDFRTPTRARRRRFVPEALGDGRLERSTGAASLAQLYADAYIEAVVRADERALGALQKGQGDVATARQHDAEKYARRAADQQRELAITLKQFAADWAVETSRFADVLPDSATLLEVAEARNNRIDLLASLDVPSLEIVHRTRIAIHDVDLRIRLDDETLHAFVANPLAAVVAATEATATAALESSEGLAPERAGGDLYA